MVTKNNILYVQSFDCSLWALDNATVWIYYNRAKEEKKVPRQFATRPQFHSSSKKLLGIIIHSSECDTYFDDDEQEGNFSNYMNAYLFCNSNGAFINIKLGIFSIVQVLLMCK